MDHANNVVVTWLMLKATVRKSIEKNIKGVTCIMLPIAGLTRVMLIHVVECEINKPFRANGVMWIRLIVNGVI